MRIKKIAVAKPTSSRNLQRVINDKPSAISTHPEAITTKSGSRPSQGGT